MGRIDELCDERGREDLYTELNKWSFESKLSSDLVCLVSVALRTRWATVLWSNPAAAEAGRGSPLNAFRRFTVLCTLDRLCRRSTTSHASKVERCTGDTAVSRTGYVLAHVELRF